MAGPNAQFRFLQSFYRNCAGLKVHLDQGDEKVDDAKMLQHSVTTTIHLTIIIEGTKLAHVWITM